MRYSVIPAKAGTQRNKKNWVPAFAGMTMLFMTIPASAQDRKPPYWASIASGKAMMRTGPGRNYPGIWLYQRRDLPIRIIQTYPNWRKFEDPDGQQGWMVTATHDALPVGVGCVIYEGRFAGPVTAVGTTANRPGIPSCSE